MRQLAVQLWTVRDQMAADRAAVLGQLAALGYPAVEPYDPLDDPAGFRALVDELGLEVAASHAPLLGEQRADLLAALRTIGTDTGIVASVPAERWTDAASIRGIAAEFNALAAEAAEQGLRVGYHNHYWEFADIDGRTALEVFAEALAPEVLLEVDTYWAAVAGLDVAPFLRTLGDRVRYLHVKDGPATREDPQTAVGDGTLPVREILAANPAVEWEVVELDDCGTDLMTALARSREYLVGQSA